MKDKKRDWLRLKRKTTLNSRLNYLYRNSVTKKTQVENFSITGQWIFLATYFIIGIIVFLIIAFNK